MGSGAPPSSGLFEDCDDEGTPEGQLEEQLADVRVLRDDAAGRNWDAECGPPRPRNRQPRQPSSPASFRGGSRSALLTAPRRAGYSFGFVDAANFESRGLLLCPPAPS